MEKDQLWKRLETWQRNIENKTTKESYLNLCEQMEEDPDPKRMPPDLDDFPYEVQMAIVIFGKLPDRIVPDIGYMGKDYTALPLHIEVANIENKEIFLETIVRLDQNVMEKSAQAMKREREKAKSRK